MNDSRLEKCGTEEVHTLYSSSYIIRMIESRSLALAGHVECMKKIRIECNIVISKSERRRPLVRPRSTIINLKEIS
jgi:hypothetical protein